MSPSAPIGNLLVQGQPPRRLCTPPPLDLSTAEVVHVSLKSVVLRFPNEDSVIKVSDARATEREIMIHNSLEDGEQSCPYLRPLIGYGSVQGAGNDLSFIHLAGWCKQVPRSGYENDGFLLGWDQVSLSRWS